MSNATSKTAPTLMSSVAAAHDRNKSVANSFLIVLVGIMLGIGALAVLPPVFSDHIASVWTYSKSQMGLIALLCLTLGVLVVLAHQRKTLIELNRLYEAALADELEKAQRRSGRVLALLNVSRGMVVQNDLQAVFEGITQTCIDGIGCDTASIMLYDPEDDSLEVRAASGQNIPQGMIGSRQKVGKGIAGMVARRREPVLLKKSAVPPGVEARNPSIAASMVVPIILRDELVGVLNVSTKNNDANWDDDDMHALQVFAENVGIAIHHTQQAEWMRATIRKLQEQKDRAGNPGVIPAAKPAETPETS